MVLPERRAMPILAEPDPELEAVLNELGRSRVQELRHQLASGISRRPSRSVRSGLAAS
jgi:hypothetical protein